VSIPVVIQGKKGSDSTISEAHVHPFGTVRGKHHGLVVLTEPFIIKEPATRFFENADFGINMNQSVAFSGTPEKIHDGTDLTLFAASSIAGGKFTFDNGDHAFEGIIEIVDYTLIDTGETVTVNGTVLTEGTNWTASTSNTATATNLNAVINAQPGVSSTSSGAFITVIADIGGDIDQLDTSGSAAELTASALAVKIDNAAVNDTMQFAKGSDLDLNNFTALTMAIYVDKDWKTGDSIDIYGYDTDLGTEVGNRVALEDYFNFGDFDTWQSLVIPLGDMALASAITVDAFRFEIVASEGKSPKFYIDEFQIQEVGSPAIFEVPVSLGTRFHIKELIFSYADEIDGTVNNGTMPGISFDGILGLPALSTGFIVKRTKSGQTLFSAKIQTLGGQIAAGGRPVAEWSDGTNTFVALRVPFEEPLVLTAEPDDTLTIQINDNMSGLLRFTVSARGSLESVITL